MADSVDVYFVQEGQYPNPSGQPYLKVKAFQAVSVLGLSMDLPYWTPDNLPRFGRETAFDGVRQPRFAVVEIGAAASGAIDFPAGFYLLNKSVPEIRDLKSKMGT